MSGSRHQNMAIPHHNKNAKKQATRGWTEGIGVGIGGGCMLFKNNMDL